MVKLYVKLIKEGKYTLDQVPPRWHDEVKKVLLEDGFLEEEKEEKVEEEEEVALKMKNKIKRTKIGPL